MLIIGVWLVLFIFGVLLFVLGVIEVWFVDVFFEVMLGLIIIGFIVLMGFEILLCGFLLWCGIL